MTVYRRPDPIPRRPGIAAPVRQSTLSVRPEQVNLSHLVARQIFGAIADGRFPEGSILPNEQDLANELGVSRTALREAINGLAAKGLLEARRRRGTKVLERERWNMLDPEIIGWLRRAGGKRISLELWRAVAAVLPSLIADAARPSSSGPLSALASALGARQEAEDNLGARRDFLLEVARLAGNRFLSSLVSTSLDSLLRDDPEFFASVTRGITGAFGVRIAEQVAGGWTPALERTMVKAILEPEAA